MFYNVFFGHMDGIFMGSSCQYGTIWDSLRIKCAVWEDILYSYISKNLRNTKDNKELTKVNKSQQLIKLLILF